MADIIHETELRLKDGVTPAMPRVKNSLLDAQKAMKGLGSQKIGGDLWAAFSGPGMNVLSKFATLAATIGGAFAGVSLVSMKNAADFESLELALTAVEGSAKKAASAMKDLKEIAKLPGLGFEEAVSGYLKLRNSGIDSGFAESIIQAFGKANARSGGGKEQFDRIMLAVSQIAMKPNLSGEELMQLNEANIPASKLVKDAFGTTDADELKKKGVTSADVLTALVRTLSQLPGVAGGAKNAFDNLSDAIKFASVEFGKGLNASLIEGVNGLGDALVKLQESGAIEALGEAIGDMASTVLDVGIGEQMDDMVVSAYEISTYFRNAALNVKQMIEGLRWVWNHSPIHWITGKWGDDNGSSGVTGGPGEIEAFRNTLEMRRRLRAQEAANEKAVNKASKDAVVVNSGELKKHTSKLDLIVENTKPLRDLADRILGGGTFGRNYVNAVNMGGGQAHQLIVQGVQMLLSDHLASANRNGDLRATGF